MTAKERDAFIRNAFDECMGKMRQKGKDYSGEIDCLHNLSRHGLKGIVVRLGDKYERVDNLIWHNQKPAVDDESVRDTLIDLINYCFLGLIFLDEENELPAKGKTPT
jgi:hypothetical protein